MEKSLDVLRLIDLNRGLLPSPFPQPRTFPLVGLLLFKKGGKKQWKDVCEAMCSWEK